MLALDSSVSTSVLIMLSNDCCLPCHTFTGRRNEKDTLSRRCLADILSWLADAEPAVPEFLFLAGSSTAIDPSLATMLKDNGDLVITPLLSAKHQEQLGIPFRRIRL